MADTNREQQYYADIISAQSERTNKRMFIIILVLIAVIVGMVTFYIWHESQFVYETTETYTSEATDGGTAIVNHDGEVHYGESDLHKND